MPGSARRHWRKLTLGVVGLLIALALLGAGGWGLLNAVAATLGCVVVVGLVIRDMLRDLGWRAKRTDELWFGPARRAIAARKAREEAARGEH